MVGLPGQAVRDNRKQKHMDLPVNTFKRRLKAGEQQIGLWVTIPDPGNVEAMAGAGYDWIVLDTEHTPVEVSSVLGMLQAVAPYPVAPVVRPYIGDSTLLKRHLDQGAQTLLVPLVESAEEAAALVRAVRYPTAGMRGVAGAHRAARFGRVKDYARRADAEICLLLQIETLAGLGRLEEIAAVEGVDGIFIGPSDLSAALGYLGEPLHPEVRKVILETIKRLRAVNTPARDPDL